jgi:tetratricopeptide (TPR) repeat protein
MTATRLVFALIFCFFLTACAGANTPPAETTDIRLLPKYGMSPKNAAQQKEDADFLAENDRQYLGDRKKAAISVCERGWYLMHRGDNALAMKRFNQAWLLDNENGSALWGMAALEGQAGKFEEALKLFGEAAPLIEDNMDFLADYAKTVGFAGLRQKDTSLIDTALSRFSYIYDRAPNHTMNLQNWAILLYFLGDYATAWEKINLAMATPGKADLNGQFIDKLQRKMAKP